MKVEKAEKPARVWVEPEEFQPLMYTNKNQYVDAHPFAETMSDPAASWTPVVTFDEAHTFTNETFKN